jgi:hypothetical protein
MTVVRSYVIYITYDFSRFRHPARGMESAMKDLAILAAVWLGMFFALNRAARYSTLWAALGASAMTGFVGVYVFLVDWKLPPQ